MSELLEKLRRNARFYQNEATALAENYIRRDNRFLGAEEAKTIGSLLTEAADYIESTVTSAIPPWEEGEG